jgi:hypothetical protein
VRKTMEYYLISLKDWSTKINIHKKNIDEQWKCVRVIIMHLFRNYILQPKPNYYFGFGGMNE